MSQKDYMYERSKIIKGQRRLYFLLFVVLLFTIFPPLFEKNAKNKVAIKKHSHYVASVEIEGMIHTDNRVIENIKNIAEDKNIKAVILKINSGGGTVYGSEILYSTLYTLSEEIPVVAVVQDVCASGAYMTALAAERIFASQASVIGSIGVYIEYFEVTELADRLGIEHGMVKSSPLKGMPNPFEKVTDEVVAAHKELIDDIYDFFKTLVQERRDMTDEELARVADARVYIGQKALALKLIDDIGGESEAFDWLVANKDIDESLDIVEYDIYQENSSGILDFVDVFYDVATKVKTLFGFKGSDQSFGLPTLQAF